LALGLPPAALEQLELKVERAFDEITGLFESLHPLRTIGTGDNHFVTRATPFASDLAPHLLTLALEDPQHLTRCIGRSLTSLQFPCTVFPALSRILLVAYIGTAVKTGETFPLPWEQVLWSASPAFPASLVHPQMSYAFTDFRVVVRRHDRTLHELALDEIDSVRLTQSWWQRITGTSTVQVRSRRNGSSVRLAHIYHGPQLALVLQLRATELFGDETKDLGADFFRSALGPDAPSLLHAHQGWVLAATFAFALMFVGVNVARHNSLPPVVYLPDDPISPHGQRRPTADVIAFMERDVMPFARTALAPIVGGADEVTCETCHGADADRRNWKMPGVRALPEPELRFAGLERARLWLDPQMRNAVYGYLAEENNQSVAAYMRHVVMPGMAKVLHRPAYDFAKSYGYNRSKAAVGCYHCHLVE